MTTMLRGLAVGFVGVLLAMSAGADDVAEAMRGIVAKEEKAVLQVKLALKETYSSPEYGSEASEYTGEITATVITAEGLMVTSFLHVDPTSLYEDMSGGEDGYSSRTEITSLKILHGEQEEEAEIVLRDRDLDLAFIRPIKKPDAPRAFVNLEAAAKPGAFDPVVNVMRLGKVAQRVASATVTRLAAVQERPRLLYFLGAGGASSWESPGMGTPVFVLTGECIGINVTRLLRANGQNGMGMSDEYDMNMASVVVPGADVLESLKQAPPYKGE